MPIVLFEHLVSLSHRKIISSFCCFPTFPDTDCCEFFFFFQPRPAPRLHALTVEKQQWEEDIGAAESDDELGDDEEAKGEL